MTNQTQEPVTLYHQPHCRCDTCSTTRALIEAGGWEWVDDGRSEGEAIRPPGVPWLLLMAGVFVTVMAVAITCAVWL